MDNVLEDIYVRLRYLLEHVSTQELQSLDDALVLALHLLLCHRNELRQVEHHRAERLVFFQESNGEVAKASADVHDLSGVGEVTELQNAAHGVNAV